jgi:hypothetical protein
LSCLNRLLACCPIVVLHGALGRGTAVCVMLAKHDN